MKWLDSFHLSDTERKGFTVLAFLLVALILIRIALIFVPEKKPPLVQIQEEFIKWQNERLEALRVAKAFDPNTVSDSLIRSFQISEFAAGNWISFRKRGNYFTQPHDLLEIYGMDSTWFEINRDSIYIKAEEESPQKQNAFKSFPFDPNSVTVDDMRTLGFPEWLAQRIINYRTKGGVFKQASDLQKIYDFPEGLYQRLLPFIVIKSPPGTEQEKIVANPVVLVELNSCDSIALLNVNGIGPVFAHRILAHRKKLGGFYSLDQLLEVYGITNERLEGFKKQLAVDQERITKLNINKASFKTLVGHYYLNYEQVKQIVNYREQIGPFTSVDALINLPHFTQIDLDRLKFYLIVE